MRLNKEEKERYLDILKKQYNSAKLWINDDLCCDNPEKVEEHKKAIEILKECIDKLEQQDEMEIDINKFGDNGDYIFGVIALACLFGFGGNTSNDKSKLN